MNADLSVVPEIAQLAAPLPAARPGITLPRTDGRVAGDLAGLAATPERWWDLVRFDPAGPVRVPLPDAPGAWLLVLPPGASVACDCAQATALAGEAAESRPLRPGHILVHGSGRTHRASQHRLHAAGHGYAVTLHATGAGPRSLPGQARMSTGASAQRIHSPGTAWSPRGSTAKSSPGATRPDGVATTIGSVVNSREDHYMNEVRARD